MKTTVDAFNIVISILRSSDDLLPKIDINKIELSSHFKNDLRFDSLAMIAFFCELQDIYPSIDESMMLNWYRIEDCCKDLLPYV
jgi:hypothetical protein